MADREFLNWLDKTDTPDIEYSEYWNNEDIEKEKEWYILDGNFIKMENYLKTAGFLEDLQICAKILKDEYNLTIHGVGIDLAAGNLWAIPYLLNLGNVDKIYCLEYSKHRLFKLGPVVLDHYNVPFDKTVLVYGSFYDLHLEDKSLDFIFLSQAFHHAGDPDRLLNEMQRVLKTNGCIVIIGEQFIGEPSPNDFSAYCKYWIKLSIHFLMPETLQEKLFHRTFRLHKIFPTPTDLHPPDPILGDHCYTSTQYTRMFKAHGFIELPIPDPYPKMSIIMESNSPKRPGEN